MNIRFSTILAVLLAAPVAAMAQNAPGTSTAAVTSPADAATTAPATGGHRHGAMMAALRTLGLSSDQMSQIKAIVKDTHAKNEGVTDPATRRANNQAMRSQIQALLTPAQQAQLKSTLQQMRSGSNASTPGTTSPTNPV